MPSCAATIATTVSRTTDTLHCFNGLQQPQRPHRPKEPEEPQRPQGWMLSFNSPPPNPPTFREEPKEYKPNQRNFHRKQDFPRDCGKPSTETRFFGVTLIICHPTSPTILTTPTMLTKLTSTTKHSQNSAFQCVMSVKWV